MKRIISLGLVIVSFLITNSCKVHNVEPVYEIVEGDQKSRLDYINIIRPVTYNEKAYFWDLGETGKMEFLNEKEVYFSGDYTITPASKNARMKAESLPEGSIVYVRVAENSTAPISISLELSGGTKFSVGYKYDYETIDPAKGVKDIMFAYRTTREFMFSAETTGGDIAGLFKKDLKDNADTKKNVLNYLTISPGFIYTIVTEEITEVTDGVPIRKKTETSTFRGKVDLGFGGDIIHKKEDASTLIKIPIGRPIVFPSMTLPGTPFTISLETQLGLAFSGEAEFNISGTIMDGYYSSSSSYEFINNEWIEKAGMAKKNSSKLSYGNISGSLRGEVKVGPYVTVSSYFNRYTLPLTDYHVAAGVFSFTAFGFASIETEFSSTGECAGNISGSLGIEVSYDYAALVVYDKDSYKAGPGRMGKKVENASFQSSPKTLLGILCSNQTYPSLSLEKFRNLLDTNPNLKFPIYDGDHPPNFQGKYQLETASLEVSTNTNDPDTKKKIGSAIITLDVNSLEIIQKDIRGEGLDYQKNTGTNNTQWLLTGSGNKFTLLAETTVRITNKDIYINYVALSAIITTDGNLENLHYAYYRKRNIIDDFTNIFPEGAIRVFKDDNGISHKLN